MAKSPPTAFVLGGLVLYMVLVASYFVGRYAGQWMENDTALITATIETLRSEGTLNARGLAYTHGFNYQTLAVGLAAATGLSPQRLQTQIYPFLGGLALTLTAYTFFKQILPNRWAALLATFLLCLQPDLLFVILRGSHEKLSWVLMLLALTLLHRSLGPRPSVGPTHRQALFAPLALFYLVLFAMIATNVFFASTFLCALLCSQGLGGLLQTLRQQPNPQLRAELCGLSLIGLSGSFLVYVFMVHLYPPAFSNLQTLRTVGEQLSALFLNFEIRGQPYRYIALGWLNPATYLSLSLFTWVLFGTSLLAWVWRGYHLRHRPVPPTLTDMLDWLLYAGFALQVALSVVVDFAGVLGANLQLRLVPVFTIFAAAMLARGLHHWFTQPGCARRLKVWVSAGASLLTLWFATAAVLKATNEPALSNKWMFATPAEIATLRWTEQHLTQATLWTSFDERLRVLALFYYGAQPPSDNVYTGFTFGPTHRYVLYSETERLRGLRLNLPMPTVLDWNRIYDNGRVQLFQRPPQTPYQR